MKIEGETCEMKADIKERLRVYQNIEARPLIKTESMDLNRNAGRSLEKAVKRLDDMRYLLEPVEGR